MRTILQLQLSILQLNGVQPTGVLSLVGILRSHLVNTTSPLGAVVVTSQSYMNWHVPNIRRNPLSGIAVCQLRLENFIICDPLSVKSLLLLLREEMCRQDETAKCWPMTIRQWAVLHWAVGLISDNSSQYSSHPVRFQKTLQIESHGGLLCDNDSNYSNDIYDVDNWASWFQRKMADRERHSRRRRSCLRGPSRRIYLQWGLYYE